MSEMNAWLALALTALFVGMSGFFVAVQFSLVAARRHRLEEAAERSVAARAALRGVKDLSLLLAGAQLGITLCTLALGAVSKPAVHHVLEPLFDGLPPAAASAVSFTLALTIVTFLHLVVGEMAPKSWAIARPERAATLFAIPMRVFMRVARPALVVLNGMADWCLRRVGVEPVDSVAAGRGPDAVRELVEHSAKAGTLSAEHRDWLASALEVNARPLGEAAVPVERIASVPPGAGVERIREVARESAHLRLVVMDHGEALGKLHVREALASPDGTTAAGLMRPVLSLPAHTPMSAAVSVMREGRSHLCLVRDREGALVGLVTLEDILDRLLLLDTAA